MIRTLTTCTTYVAPQSARGRWLARSGAALCCELLAPASVRAANNEGRECYNGTARRAVNQRIARITLKRSTPFSIPR